ncbi:MAG: FAD-dependent oxidoreductase [Candidatus Methanogranum gryphiswaldense]|nr:MAG: FAD-dependent oxidoreductase [Candidatus Methanogranum sp. U3.2.1]
MDAEVLVIGMGPAGLQAAISAARKKANTIIVGKETGSALVGAHIENYFGLSGTVKGEALLLNGLEQAKAVGTRVIRQNAISAMSLENGFTVVLESGEEVSAKAVILATGIARRKLGIPGEKEFLGKGVSYCAVCDCNFFKGASVMVVGSESEAAISAELMTKYASKVYWAVKDLDVDPSLIAKVKAAGVKIVDSMPLEILGSDKVSSVRMDNGTDIIVSGVFIELGGRSSVDLAMDLGIMPEIDDTVKVAANCMTGVEGVFACGDIVGKPWQVAKAVGQGAVAGLSAADYVKGKK